MALIMLTGIDFAINFTDLKFVKIAKKMFVFKYVMFHMFVIYIYIQNKTREFQTKII